MQTRGQPRALPDRAAPPPAGPAAVRAQGGAAGSRGAEQPGGTLRGSFASGNIKNKRVVGFQNVPRPPDAQEVFLLNQPCASSP